MTNDKSVCVFLLGLLLVYFIIICLLGFLVGFLIALMMFIVAWYNDSMLHGCSRIDPTLCNPMSNTDLR